MVQVKKFDPPIELPQANMGREPSPRVPFNLNGNKSRLSIHPSICKVFLLPIEETLSFFFSSDEKSVHFSTSSPTADTLDFFQVLFLFFLFLFMKGTVATIFFT